MVVSEPVRLQGSSPPVPLRPSVLPSCPFKRRAASRSPILLLGADYGRSSASPPPSAADPGEQRQPEPRSAMDFNVKKLASDAGVFFTRAVQVQQRPAAG